MFSLPDTVYIFFENIKLEKKVPDGEWGSLTGVKYCLTTTPAVSDNDWIELSIDQLHEMPMLALSNFSAKVIRYIVSGKSAIDIEPQPSATAGVFAIMMSTSKQNALQNHFPDPLSETDALEKCLSVNIVFNLLLNDLKFAKTGFSLDAVKESRACII